MTFLYVAMVVCYWLVNLYVTEKINKSYYFKEERCSIRQWAIPFRGQVKFILLFLLAVLPVLAKAQIISEDPQPIQVSRPHAQTEILNSGWMGAARALTASSDKKYVAVLGTANIHVFDLLRKRQIVLIKNVSDVIQIAFINADHILALTKTQLRLYRLRDCTSKTLYECRNKSLKTFCLDTGSTIYIGTSDQELAKLLFNGTDVAHDTTIQLVDVPQKILAAGRNIYIGTSFGNVLIHEKTSLQFVKKLRATRLPANSMSISDDESFLLASFADEHNVGAAFLWNLDYSDSVMFDTQINRDHVTSVHISRDGRDIIVAGMRAINIYSVDGRRKDDLSMPGRYVDPIFIPLGTDDIILGFSSPTQEYPYLTRYNWRDQKMIERLTFDSRQVWLLALSARNDQLIIGKEEGVMSIHKSGKVLFDVPSTVMVKNNIVFALTNNVTPYSDSLVVIDLADGRIRPRQLPLQYSERFPADITEWAGEKWVLYHNSLISIDAPEKKIFFDTERHQIRAFISECPYFYEQDRDSSSVTIRDIKTGKLVAHFENHDVIRTNARETVLLFSKEQNRIVRNNPVKGTREELIDYDRTPYQAEFLPDSTVIAVKRDQYGNSIRVFNLKDGIQFPQINPDATNVDAFIFSPNGRFLLTGNRLGEVEVWDFRTGTKVATLFSAFGKRDYVIITDREYDGTENGIKYLMQSNHSLKRGKQLIKMIFE